MALTRRFLSGLAASLAFCVPAKAQQIAPAPVLETDAVEVVASTGSSSARRLIPPRSARELRWPVLRAQALLEAVERIGMEGLDPADYRPGELRAAIASGPGSRLDDVAGAVFTWLAEDLRDGRVPVEARRAYLMDDPDAERLPIGPLMERALASGDVVAVLASLNPSHPDYSALRVALASTPLEQISVRNEIRANMDRWRWLPRDLGGQYLIVNVPEYRLRLMVNGETVRSYRTIVGAPGRSSTPQMSEIVEGVIFNPNWTVPQSIVVGEGLGARVLNNPAWARRNGYSATRGANGYVGVVQAPGPGNSLGAMKLDMPNQHAIFLHDTPAKQLFGRDNRALSHGCIRVEGAMELALTLAALGDGASAGEGVRISESGDYTRVDMPVQVPVYIAYFTMGVDETGAVTRFDDVYDRDEPVLASLGERRESRRVMAANF